MTLPHRIETQAANSPDAVAAAFEDRSLTYRELDARANAVALRLHSLGVRPETRVGICMERSLEMLAALLGILKAGGAYVPLDPAYPAERLAFMVGDAGAPVLVTDTRCREVVKTPAATTVCIDEDWWSDANAEAACPSAAIDGRNLAYVIYTSGSTGKPKGVQIPHRALMNFLESMRHEPGLSSEDVLLAITTLSFDIAGLELWLPLVSGARVELIGRRAASDGRRLIDALARSRATILQATPATWRMLIEAGWPGDRRLKALCGGEALSPELASELLPRCGSLWNMYGPTETTVWSTLARIEDAKPPIAIGRPIARTTVYVLDGNLEPVPQGTAGELYIGGDGVARGYLNRPDLTAEKFIANPFEPGTTFYRTGDLARYRPDGQIECLGRLDHQVKIRGFRIELGEIESALLRLPAVRQAVVVAGESRPGTKQLIAYIVPAQGGSPAIGELRAALAERLPDYMVPAVFVTLDALPLTPNGKIDRRALPPPDRHRDPEDVAAPRDALELQLVKIWETALGVSPVGIHDNFFDIGGDSLLAVGVFLRIEEALGVNLPLATLLQAPTIQQLAALLREDGWTAPWSSLVPIQPGGSRPPFYCVHGVGGNVLNYRALADHLGADQPFYGLQARGLDGAPQPLTCIDDMAAAYVAEVRTLQPEGPYYLGGASFGGNVAFEMACQLRERGDDVALVALFDTYPAGAARLPQTVDAHVWDRSGLFRRLWIHLNRLVRGPDRATYFRKKARRVVRRIIYRSWQALDAAVRAFDQPLPRVLREVQQSNYKALRDYVPRPYPGRLTLFLAAGEPYEFSIEKERGWRVLARDGLDVMPVPGDHLTMLAPPNVGVLAEALRASAYLRGKIAV